MGKTWVIDDPYEQLQRQKAKRITKVSPEKDPAAAYSLSIFFWGAGQIYNDQFGKGLVFLITMLLSCASAVLSLVYGRPLLQFLRSREISAADIFLAAELLFLCALVFWTYNAGDAYHKAAKTRKIPFEGVRSCAYPVFCSLLIPGWGQFLNGQPLKGGVYSAFWVFSVFSLVSIPSVILAWPFLEASEARVIVEKIFASSVLFAPLIPFIWLFGGYDALKVSLDDIKKEPLIDRIKSANNRRRTLGWRRGVFPHFKTTIVLGLFLIALLIVIYRYFPGSYYHDLLADAQARLHERGMTIVPELIGRVLSITGRTGT